MMNTPGPATERSFEKLTTLTLRAWATLATSRTERANSGPRINRAPSVSACWVAAAAPLLSVS
ncbi:MAG: hypothetical protein WDO24_29490 [Pseudomonadota bacterium]